MQTPIAVNSCSLVSAVLENNHCCINTTSFAGVAEYLCTHQQSPLQANLTEVREHCCVYMSSFCWWLRCGCGCGCLPMHMEGPVWELSACGMWQDLFIKVPTPSVWIIDSVCGHPSRVFLFSWHVQDVGLLRLGAEQLCMLHSTYTVNEL